MLDDLKINLEGNVFSGISPSEAWEGFGVQTPWVALLNGGTKSTAVAPSEIE